MKKKAAFLCATAALFWLALRQGSAPPEHKPAPPSPLATARIARARPVSLLADEPNAEAANSKDRALLRERYRSTPAEHRGDRGALVFSLGRHLESAEDFSFMAEVLSEAPCRSLEDCNREIAANESLAHGAGVETTLVYPQLMALKSIERALVGSTQDERRSHAIAVLRAALGFKESGVAQKAAELLRRFD